jgi:hypothetical protein
MSMSMSTSVFDRSPPCDNYIFGDMFKEIFDRLMTVTKKANVRIEDPLFDVACREQRSGTTRDGKRLLEAKPWVMLQGEGRRTAGDRNSGPGVSRRPAQN